MTVKCSDCGFLALRANDSGELCEAGSNYREDGWPKNARLVDGYGGTPLCFVRAFDLAKERADNGKEQNHIPSLNKAVISKERKCSKFCDWRQGFSPKEHAELLMFEEQHKWQKEQARWNFWATMGAAAIGFVAALAAVVVARWIQ